MFIFLLFRNLKQEQIQIRLNLVVAIAIAQITFLSGIDATDAKVSRVKFCHFKSLISYFTLSALFISLRRLLKVVSDKIPRLKNNNNKTLFPQLKSANS